MKYLVLFVCLFGVQAAKADIDVSPFYVNFGHVQVNSTISYATVYVRNIFNETVRVDVRHDCYRDIIVQNGCYGYLSAYTSCMINIQFRPRSLGQQGCYLDIQDSTNDWKSVSVSGTGIP